MDFRLHSSLNLKKSGKRSALLGIVVGVFLVLFTMGSLNIIFSEEGQPHSGSQDSKGSTQSAQKTPAETVPSPEKSDDGLWDGPVLYHDPADQTIHFILVEKAEQKLHLYRYDGRYQRLKSYFCATGENQGKKRKEKDEKTPEGIYFNDRTFRDRKITVFGDRAFGLNYPDIFDNLDGNKGSGIFIHGSNRKVAPYSTNGCLVMDNTDISDLDKRVDIHQTPVIIGERLPYRFGPVKRDISELIPFLKKALLPEKYAGKPTEFKGLTVLGFSDRVVATGHLRIRDKEEIHGTSRLFLAGPGKTLLVLVKREWSEERRKIVLSKAPKKGTTRRPASGEERLTSLVESWRRAWANKRLNDYIAYYHPAFSSKGKGLFEWKAYKGRLNTRNRKISIGISGVRVKIDGSTARAYFRQHYRSDTFRSSSYKILEFRKIEGQWKIYRENSSVGKPKEWPA